MSSPGSPAPTSPPRPADVQASFCAALVRRWAQLGLRQAMIAPGSRSTPMALALAADEAIAVQIIHDERVAAFAALGVGLATGVPAVVLCTSGTAATHFHAAIVEADLSNVPMLAISADRPPELHGVGAPQTIEQAALYGGAPRWFHDPGVPDAAAHGSWSSLADRCWAAAVGQPDPGPVHLNLPFREPLVGTVLDELLPPDAVAATMLGSALASPPLDDLVALVSGRRGLIVAGRGVGDPQAVEALATALGWPVLAEPRSGCRRLPLAVGAFDGVVRVAPFTTAHRPDVVVRLGETPASKVLAQWLVGCGATQVQIDGSTRTFDPDHVVAMRLSAPIDALCREVAARVEPAPPGWLDGWMSAERRAQRCIERVAADGGEQSLTEPAVARALTSGALATGTQLVVASSMPVRDIEWYGGPADGITVHANRGANGIDGVVATGIGVAVGTGAPTVVLLGDIALCHDASALTGLGARGLDLAIVVVDNDGGGIFSFLGQHDQLAADRFEQLFGTPHGTDLIALAQAHGLPASTVTTIDELTAAVRAGGARLIRVASDRERNVAVHRSINAEIAAALG